MSDYWFPATRPKARKPHSCVMCSRAIEPGEVYRRQVYIYDGRRDETKVCAQCEAFAIALYKAGFEGEEGGWAYLPELDAGEVAYCGYSAELTLFRHRNRHWSWWVSYWMHPETGEPGCSSHVITPQAATDREVEG